MSQQNTEAGLVLISRNGPNVQVSTDPGKIDRPRAREAVEAVARMTGQKSLPRLASDTLDGDTNAEKELKNAVRSVNENGEQLDNFKGIFLVSRGGEHVQERTRLV